MGLNSAVLNSVWVETALGFLGGLGVSTEFGVWMTFRKEGPGRITVRDGVALEEAFLLGAEWLPLSTSHHALRSHTRTLQVCLLRGYPSLPKPGAFPRMTPSPQPLFGGKSNAQDQGLLGGALGGQGWREGRASVLVVLLGQSHPSDTLTLCLPASSPPTLSTPTGI